MNAVGYATTKKYDLLEAQVRYKLTEWKVLDKFSKLEFQRVGIPNPDPKSQLAVTTYVRMFMQAEDAETIHSFLKAIMFNGMQHFAGYVYLTSRRGNQLTIADAAARMT